MNGAQRNFQVYGKPTSENKPISARETSAERNQAGISWMSRYNGMPEARPVMTQISMRRLTSCSSNKSLIGRSRLVFRKLAKSKLKRERDAPTMIKNSRAA